MNDEDERARVRAWAEAAERDDAPRAAFFLTYAADFVVAAMAEVKAEPQTTDERLPPFLYAMQ